MNTFTRGLADLCAQQPAAEKRLLAPSRRVGLQWLDRAALAGRPSLACRVETLRSLALDLAAPALAAAGLALVPRHAAHLLADAALAGLRPGRLRYLGAAAPGAGLAAALLRTLEALRLEGVPAARLRRGVLEDDDKAADLRAILRAYLGLLDRERLADYPRVLELAIARLGREPGALGAGAVVVLPGDLERSGLERRLLAALPEGCLRELPVDPPGLPEATRFAQAVGEVNEVRAALRSCLARGIPLDGVELLHTDARVYVPLVLEAFAALERPGAPSGDPPPATFAEGIPCDRSRPGRALAAWVRWVRGGFPQGALVAMVRDGLLVVGDGDGPPAGFSRLAALLRAVGIGFGRDRYLPKIDARIAALERRLAVLAGTPAGDEGADGEEGGGLPADLRRAAVARDLEALRSLRVLAARLLELAPAAGGGAPLVAAAERFLETCARSADRFDGFAAKSLRDELAEMGRWLARAGAGAFDAAAWLATLPAEVRVLGSGPRPGCLHVDRVGAGGHSGRPVTFVLGLDDARFPGGGAQDPLLLDRERAALAPGMPTAAGRLEEAVAGFGRLLGRLRGEVTLSWACRSLVEERELFPSPLVLGAYREGAGRPAADQAELLAAAPPHSFAPALPEQALDRTEWWLWRLTGGGEPPDPDALLARHAPELSRGRAAAAMRAGEAFTAWDGSVREAGAALDPGSPTGKVLSAGGLETAGACPLRFFFKYALEIAPPEELVVDPARWLDPLARGSLLHELFEEFLGELVDAGLVPAAGRDGARLRELLERKIAAALDAFPPPSEAVFRRERAQLAQIAATFLAEEERFCRDTGSRPRYLEAALGMPPGGRGTAVDTLEPLAVELPGGRVIRARGRVDRIDAAGGVFAVWDYKTGSTYGFDRASPFAEGRKIQPWLYLRMVERRLRESVDPGARAGLFGYFFPGVRAAGERISWPAERLAAGGDVLALLCRLIAAGAFVATTDHEKDCAYCDYRAACGDVAALAAAARRKVAVEPLLEPVRTLRAASLAKTAKREGGEP
jgi:ATP-dependent helicase/nuclease subunit B